MPAKLMSKKIILQAKYLRKQCTSKIDDMSLLVENFKDPISIINRKTEEFDLYEVLEFETEELVGFIEKLDKRLEEVEQSKKNERVIKKLRLVCKSIDKQLKSDIFHPRKLIEPTKTLNELIPYLDKELDKELIDECQILADSMLVIIEDLIGLERGDSPIQDRISTIDLRLKSIISQGVDMTIIENAKKTEEFYREFRQHIINDGRFRNIYTTSSDVESEIENLLSELQRKIQDAESKYNVVRRNRGNIIYQSQLQVAEDDLVNTSNQMQTLWIKNISPNLKSNLANSKDKAVEKKINLDEEKAFLFHEVESPSTQTVTKPKQKEIAGDDALAAYKAKVDRAIEWIEFGEKAKDFVVNYGGKCIKAIKAVLGMLSF